jgi:transcriptional regulator with XRE-family HTH domain
MTDPEAIAAAIARNVHALRSRRFWTLDALATRSGISKGMLVQIEQARTNPSIATLCRIADALGVTVPQLVELDESPPVRIVRAADTVELWHGLSGSVGTLLIGSGTPDESELWDWRIAPGDNYDGAPHPPGAREILFVLAGTLTLLLGAEPHTAAKGDALLFRADRPHRYANNAKVPLRFIMVTLEQSRARS